MDRRAVYIFVMADLIVVIPRLVLAFLWGDNQTLGSAEPVMIGFTAVGSAIILSTGAALVAHALFSQYTTGIAKTVLTLTWVAAVAALLGITTPALMSGMRTGQDLTQFLIQRQWDGWWAALSVFAPIFVMLGIMGSWALSEQTEPPSEKGKSVIDATRGSVVRWLNSKNRHSDNVFIQQGDTSKTDDDLTGNVKVRQDELSKSDALERMIDILESNPSMSKDDLADAIGRSRATVYNYKSELEEEGRLEDKEDGWYVTNGKVPA